MTQNNPIQSNPAPEKVNRVKLKNFDKPKIMSRAERLYLLEEKAKSFVKKQEKFQFLTKELTFAFIEMIDEEILPSQMGPKHKEGEALVLQNFLNLANEMNEDEDLPEGFGSLGLIALLLKTFISFRNKLNIACFENKQLEERIKFLEIKNDK